MSVYYAGVLDLCRFINHGCANWLGRMGTWPTVPSVFAGANIRVLGRYKQAGIEVMWI